MVYDHESLRGVEIEDNKITGTGFEYNKDARFLCEPQRSSECNPGLMEKRNSRDSRDLELASMESYHSAKLAVIRAIHEMSPEMFSDLVDTETDTKLIAHRVLNYLYNNL